MIHGYPIALRGFSVERLISGHAIDESLNYSICGFIILRDLTCWPMLLSHAMSRHVARGGGIRTMNRVRVPPHPGISLTRVFVRSSLQVQLLLRKRRKRLDLDLQLRT